MRINNLVAKYSHLTSRHKIHETAIPDMVMVVGYRKDGTIAESDIFDTAESASDFEEELKKQNLHTFRTLL